MYVYILFINYKCENYLKEKIEIIEYKEKIHIYTSTYMEKYKYMHLCDMIKKFINFVYKHIISDVK